ncbi:sensor histidine kinase, partial [Actinocorallia lasiicapitis]
MRAPRLERSKPRRRWGVRTIRARIGLILTVPAVLLITIAVLGTVNQVKVSGEADATAENVELVLSVQELIHSLQRERGLTSGLLGGETAYQQPVEQQRKKSDAARLALDKLLGAGGSAAHEAVSTALDKLTTLGDVRGSADARQITRPRLLDFYTTGITALADAAASSDVGQNDKVLRRGLASLHTIGRAKESTALERGHLNGVFALGQFTQDDYIRFTETRAKKVEALNSFPAVATQERSAQLEAVLRTPQATLAASFEQRALLGANGQKLRLNPAKWWSAMTQVVDDERALQIAVGEDVRARSQEIKASARQWLFVYGGVAGATILLALGLWAYTFRSIMRPIQILTAEAHDAAESRLPRAVDLIQGAADPSSVVLEQGTSTLARRDDEFAEVARALDNLQSTAVRLAVQQAVMRRNTAESLANLGRRNQNLVRRQLGFISALEKEEADPNQLANLFELDHLATRMRRNAESLLVLVGEHSPRKWSGSISVGDILRSALAEVEDYRRVILRRVDDGQLRGAVAAEVSHLLAELVENALSFSPPDQEVEVSARATANEYHIAIVDSGLGMSAEALAEANVKLRGEQSFLVQPTRDLGHFVVGQLAVRLGVRVWLHESPLNGVTARVVLPASVLMTSEVRRPEPPQPVAVGSRPGPAAYGTQPTGAFPVYDAPPVNGSVATLPPEQ